MVRMHSNPSTRNGASKTPARPATAATLFAASALVAALGVVEVAAEPSAEDWPQFRGPHRDGMSPAAGLLDSWPEEGPKELWRRPLGEGFSAVSVAGGRLYTMYAEAPAEEVAGDGATDEQAAAAGEQAEAAEVAAAFDAATGEELWRVAIGKRIVTQFGNGPRSTPTVDGDTVYVLGAHGELVALATEDGTERWATTLADAFGTQRPYWGFSTSPMVEGELLLIANGGPEGKAFAALDKATGEVRWTAGDGGPQGTYNSPLPVTMNGERVIVYVGNQVLRAVDAGGEEVWSHPWPEGETHAMPIYIPPDRFFASGAEGVGAALIRIANGDGGAKAEEVWSSRTMRNHFSSSIFLEDHLYGFDNATLKCISVETGEQAWAKRGFGKGSLIYADGHLIVLSDRGTLALVRASAEGYVEKGRVQALEGRCWTAPSLAGGKLYLRGETEMVSYDLKAEE